MAPKDCSTKGSQPQQLYLQHHHHRSTPVSLEDEISLVSSGSGSQNDKNTRGWKQYLIVHLRKLMRGEDETIRTQEETDSDDSSNQQLHQQQHNQQLGNWGSAAAITTVAALLLYKLGKNRRLKQRLWPILLALFRKPDHHNALQVSLSLLRSAAVQGIVSKALIGSSEIVFQDSSSGKWKRSLLPPNSPNLQSDLLDLLAQNGCADVSTLPPTLWSKVSGPLLTAVPFIYLGLVYKIFKNIHGDDGGNANSKLLDNSKQTTRFTDIAGLDSVIGEVNDIVCYLKNPSYYLQLGAQPPRGILLHGPPGSGKTLLAQALAGEGDCDAFITCSGSEFCEMYVGRGM